MKIEELDDALENALARYSDQIHSDIETFWQHRKSPYLTKDDFEEVARQTFYMLDSFREEIIKYLKVQKVNGVL